MNLTLIPPTDSFDFRGTYYSTHLDGVPPTTPGGPALYSKCTTTIKNNTTNAITTLSTNGEQIFNFTSGTTYNVTMSNEIYPGYENICRLNIQYRKAVNNPLTNRQVGSFRIKKITNNGFTDNNVVKEYEYKLDDGITSSGIIMDPPLTSHKQDYFFNKSGSLIFKCPYDVYYSTSYNPVNTNFGKSVGYTKVTEKQTDNNGILKKDLYYTIGYRNVEDINFLMMTPRSDQSYKNGLLEKEIIYKDNDSIMVKKYNYDFDTHFNQSSFDHSILPSGGDDAISFGMVTKVDDICGGVSNDGGFIYEHYPIFSHWVKPITQTNILYFNGLAMETETMETYRSDYAHINPEKEIITYPDNSIQESQYKYAQDLNISDLISANMLKIPLQMEVKLKRDSNDSGTLTSKNKTNFANNSYTSNHLLPVTIENYDLINPGNINNVVSYDIYGSKGNLVQYTLKNNSNEVAIPVTIIWGYGETLPIAKVEGARYSDVSMQSSDILQASNASGTSYSETVLQSLLDTFRKNLSPTGYKITTYTYDPLVGVKTITPPNGIKEMYVYDAAGRLQYVKNTDGKVIKENRYNFKQP